MKKKHIILIIVLIVIGVFGSAFARLANKQTFIAKVTDKERVVKRSGDGIESNYLVFTEDGTYKVEDELIYFNFRSSDMYGAIKKDSTYTFTTIGFRVGLMSWYPNIVKVE